MKLSIILVFFLIAMGFSMSTKHFEEAAEPAAEPAAESTSEGDDGHAEITAFVKSLPAEERDQLAELGVVVIDRQSSSLYRSIYPGQIRSHSAVSQSPNQILEEEEAESESESESAPAPAPATAA